MTDPADYLSLPQAARLAPGQPHPCAVWRWCRKGIKSRSGKRVYLRHVRAGYKIFTTAAWLEQFFKSVAAADRKHFDKIVNSTPAPKFKGKPKPKPRTDAQRRRGVQRAKADLAAAGI